MLRIAILLVAVIMALVLGSCGSSGGLAKDLSAASAEFVVLDLQTGSWSTRTAVDDLAVNPAYRDRLLVFRGMAAGSGVVGSLPGAFAAQDDQARSAATTGRLLIGVFEVTQAQWERLAGTTPWADISTEVTGTPDTAKAAIALSLDAVESALAAYVHDRIRLRLPSAVEWERACRAGSAGSFAWGEARDDATVAQFAVVSETAGATVGPRPVGGRTMSAYGFYDLHGNVWELTADGDIRGGSWRDSLPSARCAHITSLDRATAHPLVGARLVLEFR